MPKIDDAKDLPAAISGVLQAVSDGSISPSEGQSIVDIIESQRKAIETGELLERLEKLEASTGRS
jgi:hypothetical protein